MTSPKDIGWPAAHAWLQRRPRDATRPDIAPTTLEDWVAAVIAQGPGQQALDVLEVLINRGATVDNRHNPLTCAIHASCQQPEPMAEWASWAFLVLLDKLEFSSEILNRTAVVSIHAIAIPRPQATSFLLNLLKKDEGKWASSTLLSTVLSCFDTMKSMSSARSQCRAAMESLAEVMWALKKIEMKKLDENQPTSCPLATSNRSSSVSALTRLRTDKTLLPLLASAEAKSLSVSLIPASKNARSRL